jgi:hypothetical protein
MKKINFESVLRKTLSTAYVFGVCGGMYISGMRNFASSKSAFILLMQLVILVACGSFMATAVRNFKLKRIKKATAQKDDIELKIAEQNSFFIVIGVMAIAHFLNSDMNEWNRFSAMLLTGGVFLLSMVNGHLDISTYAPKYLLSLGIIPIMLSFVLGYSVHNNRDIIDLVWIFGFLAFLSFLLILSNSQLNSKLFSSKHINVANRRRIKLFNFGIVGVFFIICIIVVNFKRIIEFMGKAVNGLTQAAGAGFRIIAFWLLKDSDAERIVEESEKELPKLSSGAGQSTLFDVIFITLLIIILVTAISISVIMIKRHKLTKIKIPAGNPEEFDDDSEIIIEKLHLKLGKRFHYTIKELEKIEDMGERTRYLYGFIIERLYYKKVSILKSDTPDDILHKAFECDNGNLLEDLGFEELTEKYRRVRYGSKKSQFDGDMCEVAREYERVILSFYGEGKGNN